MTFPIWPVDPALWSKKIMTPETTRKCKIGVFRLRSTSTQRCSTPSRSKCGILLRSTGHRTQFSRRCACSGSAGLHIDELIEHKQGMVAGAAELPVVGCVLLIAMGRADAGTAAIGRRPAMPSIRRPDSTTSDPRLSGCAILSVSKRPI